MQVRLHGMGGASSLARDPPHPLWPPACKFRNGKRKFEHIGTWRKKEIRKQHKLQHRACCFSKKMAAESRNQGHQFKNHFTLFLGVFTHTHTILEAQLKQMEAEKHAEIARASMQQVRVESGLVGYWVGDLPSPSTG